MVASFLIVSLITLVVSPQTAVAQNATVENNPQGKELVIRIPWSNLENVDRIWLTLANSSYFSVQEITKPSVEKPRSAHRGNDLRFRHIRPRKD